MKIIQIFYIIIIIILRSRGVIQQNASDFTLEELKHLSGKLKPVECMRLIEAIYPTIPSYSLGQRSIVRETPVNVLISKHVCLDELRTWSRQFPENTETKARVLMVLHLNAIGRYDLENYLRKNDPKYNKRISKKVSFRNNIRRGRTHRIYKTDNEDEINFNRRIIAADAREVRQVESETVTQLSGKWKYLSKNCIIVMIVLCLIATLLCGFLMFVLQEKFRRSATSNCCENRKNSCETGRSIIDTEEKGLQCIDWLENDYLKRIETQSKASQISEIDIEGLSCGYNFSEIETRKNISDTTLSAENETVRVSIENEESNVQRKKKPRGNNSCKCNSRDRKTCCESKQRKRKKRKKKVKDECKSTKNYLKAMKEKILPSKEKRSGVCECCNCGNFHRQNVESISGSCSRVRKRLEKGKKNEIENCGGSKLRRGNRKEHFKNDKTEDREPILTYNAIPIASKSPKLNKQLKKSEAKSSKCSSRKKRGTSKLKKVRILTSSSDTEVCKIKDKPKRSF